MHSFFEGERQSQAQDAASRLQQLDYFEQKGQEYRKQRAAFKVSIYPHLFCSLCQGELQRAGMGNDFTHGALLKLNDDIVEMKKRTEAKVALLQAYHDLLPVHCLLILI